MTRGRSARIYQGRRFCRGRLCWGRLGANVWLRRVMRDARGTFVTCAICSWRKQAWVYGAVTIYVCLGLCFCLAHATYAAGAALLSCAACPFWLECSLATPSRLLAHSLACVLAWFSGGVWTVPHCLCYQRRSGVLVGGEPVGPGVWGSFFILWRDLTFTFPASGQAVVTGVVPFSSAYHSSFPVVRAFVLSRREFRIPAVRRFSAKARVLMVLPPLCLGLYTFLFFYFFVSCFSNWLESDVRMGSDR